MMRELTRYLTNKLYLTPQSRRVRAWLKVNGDHTLRLNYSLSSASIVFDLGGFEGKFAREIFEKYGCKVYVFEPVTLFYRKLENLFEQNDDINVFPFGLAGESTRVLLGLDKDRSSTYRLSGETQEVQLQCFGDFLRTNEIQYIDLIKINIEGGEYDLLESVLAQNLQNSMVNLQVQFHDFVPDAAKRMRNIHQGLSRTHELTWCYPYVWENWRIRNYQSGAHLSSSRV